MVRKFLAIFVVSSSLALAACNTVEGVGEDVQSAGEAVEDAAD
jgi:predicted small secreted protein